MAENLTVRFGKLLAGRRKARGLTQEELANKAEISTSMVTQMETGVSAPSINTVEVLAAVLEIDPSELFTANVTNKSVTSRHIHEISAELSKLNESDLLWIRGIIEAALNRKR